MKKRLSVCLMLLGTTACGGSTALPESPAEVPGQSEAAVVGKLRLVLGDLMCPSDQYLAPPSAVRTYLKPLCLDFGQLSFTARLGDGGSFAVIDGSCYVQDLDDRNMKSSLCMAPIPPPFTAQGDGVCPEGAALVSAQTARDMRNELCGNILGSSDVVRLAGGGSMSGRLGGCTIQDKDSQPLRMSLCQNTEPTFSQVPGDGPCEPWEALVSPQEAQDRIAEICPMLGRFDVVRLSGRGMIRGVNYGNTCGITTWDTRSAGKSLCKSLY